MDCANFVFHHAKGRIFGYISDVGLQALLLPRKGHKEPYLLHSAPNIVLGKKLRDALERYFAGVAVDFMDIPLDLPRVTPFRRKVWMTTRKIRFGKMCTYGEIAKRMGYASGASRAVGTALGANPIPIIIPCHRVVAAGGGLGGFSAGLDWKRALLNIEGHEVSESAVE